MGLLTVEQLAEFADVGYLVVPAVVPDDALHDMNAEVDRLVVRRPRWRVRRIGHEASVARAACRTSCSRVPTPSAPSGESAPVGAVAVGQASGRRRNGMIVGGLIAESLRVGSMLEGVTLRVTKVSRADVGDVDAGQPRTWTFLDFEADDDDAERLARALEGALERTGGWYCDFRNDTETFVVFAGRTFRYAVAATSPVAPRWPSTPAPSASPKNSSTGRSDSSARECGRLSQRGGPPVGVESWA